MDIKCLGVKRIPEGDDLTQLDYSIDGDEFKLEVGGTALSMLGIEGQDLATTFTPLVSSIYAELDNQGVNLDSVSIDSRGVVLGKSKIIYSLDEVKDKLD